MGILGQLLPVDVGNAHHIAPIAQGQAGIPFVMGAVGLVFAAFRIFNRIFAQVADNQTCFTAFRVNAVQGVRAPYAQPDRSQVITGAAGINDVLAVFCRLTIEARSQAGKALRRGGGVAVEQGISQVLVHTLYESTLFAQAPGGRITVQIGQRLIGQRVAFQHPHAVFDGNRGRFLRLHTVVQHTPSTLRQTAAHRSLMLSEAVGFHPRGIFQNLIGFRQHFDDIGDVPLIIHAAGHIGQSRIVACQYTHCLPLLRIHVACVVKTLRRTRLALVAVDHTVLPQGQANPVEHPDKGRMVAQAGLIE